MNSGCPFCSHEISDRALFIGRHALVILSNPRLVYGHLLIIPKRHVLKYSELEEKELLEMFSLLSKYQEKILQTLSKGTEVRQSYVPYKENTKTHVNHLHFNLLPRDRDDEYSKIVDIHIRQLYEAISEAERQKLTELLKD